MRPEKASLALRNGRLERVSQTQLEGIYVGGLAAKGKCLTLKCKSATKLTLKCKISKTKKTAFTTSKAAKYLDKDGRQRLKLDTNGYNDQPLNNQNLTAIKNTLKTMKIERFTTIFKNHYKKKLDTKSYNNHSHNNQNLTASANARANNRQPRPSGAPASF